MAVSINLIAQTIEKVAPKFWAEEWDNVGLLVGNGSDKVEKILLALDGTEEVVKEAKELGAQLIVAHHPIIFRPLRNLREDNQSAKVPLSLLRNGIAYYAAHTNLDQSSLSSSWTLGNVLGLKNMEILTPIGSEKLVKLVVFVPKEAVEKVRTALAEVGVGESVTEGPQSDRYAECFYQSSGEGMFRPLAGANPHIGNVGELTRVEEVRLESILPEGLVDRAVRALRKAHPYEEPAYDLIPLRNAGKARGYGVIGYLPEAKSLGEFWKSLREILREKPWAESARKSGEELDGCEVENSLGGTEVGIRLAGDLGQTVRKVAIVNGSGSSAVAKAMFKGADVLITGDVDHHAAVDALAGGMAIGDIGHFVSERPMLDTLAEYLRAEKALQGVDIVISKVNSAPWVG